ncbi:MAG: ADP-ribosylglycohydrolase family protein [Propionibacteriaceae bacterium]|nr:ADP-ribosylglycohydrolase family protein [Propionibacteriaceae bacterium]
MLTPPGPPSPGEPPIDRFSPSPAQLDRAAGVLVGQACGDALGVPYEFAAAPLGEPEMIGGGLGPYAPGEWSDDTQMAVCIARVAATGADLTSDSAQDEIAIAFEQWLTGGATDVGVQTGTLLRQVRDLPGRRGELLRAASRTLHRTTGRSAGNGALMRTAIVGLTRITDPKATAAAARAVAELTHFDPLGGDSCVLWSEWVRRAVLDGWTGDSLPELALELVPAERRDQWRAWITEAVEDPRPDRFENNGYTVTALQAALAAVVIGLRQHDSPDLAVRAGLIAAVRAGHDTDTVAAIAGGALGALFGRSAIPTDWQTKVHGWPGMGADDLAGLCVDTLTAGS